MIISLELSLYHTVLYDVLTPSYHNCMNKVQGASVCIQDLQTKILLKTTV